MTNNRNFWGNGRVNTGSLIIGAVVLVVMLVVLLSLARLTYRLLTFIAIPLLIITAIIDYKIIVNYFNWVVSVVKRNTLMGIGLSLLSLVFYPVVAAILFGRAFFTWRLDKAMKAQGNVFEEEAEEQKRIGEYIDFEEVKEKRQPIKQPRVQKKDSNYDQFFEE
ncbi:MAG: hypothetical protein AAF847_05580 [Bacteroidota bacterium]